METLNLEQKALKFTELKALNEQELRAINGGIRINFFGLLEYESTHQKGHRWKWAWQKEW